MPRKETTTDNVWNDLPPAPPSRKQPEPEPSHGDWDLEGLQTDFPTARELERFVFDQTGISLNLRGRSNRKKYQTALDVLSGRPAPADMMGDQNPYVDKSDMVPVEELREPPARDASLPGREHVQNQFHSRKVPHTDAEFRARGRCIDVTFRKYDSGVITYEVLGPIDQRAEGEKQDKFGRIRPEIIRWIDPRTGEQIVQRADGTLTPVGRRLRAMMQTLRVNNSNQWDLWVDRDFITVQEQYITNPWATDQ